MQINKKVLIFAILLGVITVVLLYSYLNTLNKEKVVTVDETDVIVATDTIPAHVEITADMLTVESVPVDTVHSDAVLDMDEIVGAITSSEIIEGEQILSERIETEGSGSSLSYSIPADMRAITVPITEITGVAGYIVTGDMIDILVSYTDTDVSPEKVVYTQLQNIEVLEVGMSSSSTTDTTEEADAASMTILVTPEQAEVVAFANVNGTFQFTLRNPSDTEDVNLQEFGVENFDTWRDR